jgi:AdoMet-dependent heme synthase
MPTNPNQINKIHWNTLSQCNMRCHFCYLWRRPDSAILTTNIAKQLIEEASKCVEWFVFGGGDPLMRKDLLELVEFASRVKLKIDLQTNAVLISQTNSDYLFKRLNRLGLSLDGENADTHDSVRNYSGNFDMVMTAIKLAESANTPVTIRTLVCNENLHRLKHIADILINFSCIQKWSLRQFVPLGRGQKFQSQFGISKDQFDEEILIIESHTRRFPVNFEIATVTADDMKCRYCFVSESGYIYQHPCDGHYYSIGKFPEEHLLSIISRLPSEAYQRENKDYSYHTLLN